MEKNYIKFQVYLMAIYDKKLEKSIFYLLPQNSDFARFNVTLVLNGSKEDLFFFRLHTCYMYMNLLHSFLQVKTIRDGLRKVGLGAVDVETIENVQGK